MTRSCRRARGGREGMPQDVDGRVVVEAGGRGDRGHDVLVYQRRRIRSLPLRHREQKRAERQRARLVLVREREPGDEPLGTSPSVCQLERCPASRGLAKRLAKRSRIAPWTPA